MAFRSVNINPPKGPRRGGTTGGNYRGGGGSGFNSSPAFRIDPSGRVDQGFGPVGGAAALNDLEFDIFGVDDPSLFQPQQQQQQAFVSQQNSFDNNNPQRGRGRGRGGRGNFNNQGQRDGYQQGGGNPGTLELQIRGWDGAGNRDDIVAFLLRKFGVQIQNRRYEGTTLYAAAPNPTAFQTLLNASGTKFAGKYLDITAASNSQGFGGDQPGFTQPQRSRTYEILLGFLSTRYNPELGLLNLSNLRGDETLKATGFFNQPSTARKIFPALMKVASENIPGEGIGVISISLADNNMRDVRDVSELASYFPKLQNLSLQNNQITRWSDLDAWGHGNFPQLQELLLLDNPIQRNTRDPEHYQRQIARLFPNLLRLDGVQLGSGVTKIKFGVEGTRATPSNELPGRIRQGFWGEGSSEIGVSFLGIFFPLFDTNRQALLHQFYTPTSLFSLSVDTYTPHQRPDRRGAFSGANQPNLQTSLHGYIQQSRNLLRARAEHQRVTKLHQGRDQIAQAFQYFPQTKHPIEESAAFVADGFQVQIGTAAGIMVAVHGEFIEYGGPGGQELRRSFDRTFLLGPPVPATIPGSQCVVVSDLLVLRPYSGREAWVPEEGAVGPAVDAQGLIAEVRRRTKLNEHFAGLLLQECNGDLEAAGRRFEEARTLNQIPPEAFQ